MIEWLIEAALIGAAFIAVSFALNDIFERLPPRFKTQQRPLESPRIALWVRVERFYLQEFCIGHIDGWDIGHSLRILASGNVKVGEETIEKRVSFLLSGHRGRYAETNVIGRASKKGEDLEVRLWIEPDQVRDILDELRVNSDITLHVHGWQDGEGFQLEYFSMEP